MPNGNRATLIASSGPFANMAKQQEYGCDQEGRNTRPIWHSRPGPGPVYWDTAPWRAWRWGVQSDGGELLPFLQDSASGETASFRVLMAREPVFPSGGLLIRMLVAEKLVALHFPNSWHPPCYGWPVRSFRSTLTSHFRPSPFHWPEWSKSFI